MKTYAIFGATGQTGLHLVSQTLKAGNAVKAIVRNADKLKTSLKSKFGDEVVDNANLNIVKVGNIFKADNLVEPLTNVDLVFSTLGFGRGSTGYEDFTKAMVEALKKIEGGCRRTVIMHSWMTEASVRQRAPFFLRWTLLAYIGPILDNMRLAEKYLESVDDIDYAFILPAGLRNSPVTEKAFTVKEDDWYIDNVGHSIARADVARYMLKTADEDLHHKKIVAIATE